MIVPVAVVEYVHEVVAVVVVVIVVKLRVFPFI
jgi:hypothetical protein